MGTHLSKDGGKNMMKYLNIFFEKTFSLLDVTTWYKRLAAGFENDNTAGWLIGVVLAGMFLMFYYTSPLNAHFAAITPWITALLIFLIYPFIYKMMPTGEEHWGRAPKRVASKIFNWLAVIIIIATLVGGLLFYHFSGLVTIG